MKYSVKDLLDKRGNNKFIPLSGVDRIKDKILEFIHESSE